MKILETIFSINGRLQPGFNAAFGTAEKKVKGLGASANQVGAAFSKLGRTLITLGAAYLGWKGIQSFFGEALKASEANAAVNLKLLNTLRANQRIQAAGPGVAEEQYQKMVAISQELSKQGVLGGRAYRTAMATAVQWGLAPEKAARLSAAMGDVAVQQHGVNVSAEEFGSLMERATKAITTGATRGLGPLVAHMTEAEKKAWKTANEAQRLETVIRLAERAAKGFNAEAAKTPEGKIVAFRKEWGAFITEIGDNLRPLQAQLAELQSAMLKAIGPEIIAAINSLKAAFAAPEFQQTLADFRVAWKELGDALKPIAEAFGMTEFSGKSFGQWIAGDIQQTIKDFTGLISGVAKVLKDFGDDWNRLTARLQQAGVFDFVSSETSKFRDDWQQLVLNIDQLWSEVWEKIAQLLTEFGDDWNKLTANLKDLWGDAWGSIRNLLTDFGDDWNRAVANIKDIWGKVPQIFSDTNAAIKRALEDVYNSIVDPFRRAIDWVTQQWNNLKSLIAAPFNIGNILGGGGPKAAPAAAAAPTTTAWGGMQLGGIVNRPTYSLLGEAGPEAVIPLERTARSLQLLARAAGALGVPMGGGGGGANVGPFNYGPTLNMGPGAEPGMLARAREMLRTSADDFFSRYQAVWDEERRLAFE